MVREVQQVAWGLGILLLVSCSAEGPLESEGELQQAATVQTACEGMTVPPPAPGRYKILQVTAGTDTTIREAQPSKNFRSENFCYTQFEADAAQACLIRFPIELPATAQIHYAQLGLQLTAASPTRVLAYSMDKRWTEAGATWNRYNSRTPWSTPGAQSDKRWSFCALTASTGHVTYNLGGAAVAQIQDWVSGRAENSGIGIFADATSGGREVSVVAHDASVDAPVLTLWYTDDP
ncbi:MAG: hypothetical protein K0R38_3643, partial [Polyangiaceae bacterium]|nr:hypothetical protein [Polyangiaceae bacterium]